MEGDEHHQVLLACSVCGALFSILSPLSVWILWAVNWRPWRIYRYCLHTAIVPFGSIFVQSVVTGSIYGSASTLVKH